MNTVIGIIIGLLVLMLLVVAHELGHFIAARRNGVKVNEFGIGFPPRATAWVKNPEYEKWLKVPKDARDKKRKPKKWLKLKRKDWKKTQKTLILSLNWLPIGGFCAMDGESDADTKKGTFGAASFWGKTKILFAGVAANWLVAFLILTVLSVTGMPHFMDDQFTMQGDTSVSKTSIFVEKIKPGSPAEKAGIEVGDEIIEGVAKGARTADKLGSSVKLTDFNTAHAGEEVTFHILRNGQVISAEPTLNAAGSSYYLGTTVRQEGRELYYSTWSAPIVGAVTTVQLTGETFRGLWNLIWDFGSGVVRQFSFDDTVREQGREAIGTAGESVSGPVGIIGVLFPAFTETGPTNLAFLAAIISISLACMNVLPIPALDGGRWFLISIFRIRGKKLDKKTEEKIVSRAFLVLLILIAVITVLDVIKLF